MISDTLNGKISGKVTELAFLAVLVAFSVDKA